MNPTQQRNHRTVTHTIAQSVEQIAAAAAARMDRLERAINDERTHRLKLAEEQRGYVDARDRELRECCWERWDSTSQTTKRLFDEIGELRNRGFWSRLNWLLTGR